MEGKSRRQILESVGRISSTVRKQTLVSASVQFSVFFLFSSERQPMEWHCLHLNWLFLPQLP